jgi:hypothetical protein
MCVEMMSQEWLMTQQSADIPPFLLLPEDRGMTLLHLAAALGYTRLVLTLIQWKRENPSSILDSEVDPWKADDFGLIPLVRTTKPTNNFFSLKATFTYLQFPSPLHITSSTKLTRLLKLKSKAIYVCKAVRLAGPSLIRISWQETFGFICKI